MESLIIGLKNFILDSRNVYLKMMTTLQFYLSKMPGKVGMIRPQTMVWTLIHACLTTTNNKDASIRNYLSISKAGQRCLDRKGNILLLSLVIMFQTWHTTIQLLESASILIGMRTVRKMDWLNKSREVLPHLLQDQHFSLAVWLTLVIHYLILISLE